MPFARESATVGRGKMICIIRSNLGIGFNIVGQKGRRIEILGRMNKNFLMIILWAILLVAASCGGGGGGGSNPGPTAPPSTSIGLHPENWVVDHGATFITNSSQCLPCHASDLRGGTSKVSFFLGSFQGQYCHPNGLPKAPHALPIASPALHGTSGKENLSFCQTCHGTPGTINFNGGLAATACSACHLAAKAHPTDWQGSGLYSHRTSGNRNVACAICHNVAAATPAGPDPKSPSCFSGSFTNANGQARNCHSGGP